MPSARTILNRGDSTLRPLFGRGVAGDAVSFTIGPGQAEVVCIALFDAYETERELRGNNTYKRNRGGSLVVNKDANPQLAAVLAALGRREIPDHWLATMAETAYAITESREDSTAWTIELEGINP